MSIRVREFCDSDIEALTNLYNHYILTTTITFDITPYTVEQRKRLWLQHYTHTGRHRLFVAVADDSPIGYASSSKLRTKAAYDTSVETSIYLAPEWTGNGVGCCLYETLFEALKAQDVHRAYAGITLPNDASVSIHERFGFERVGLFREVGRKFGRYWDVAWFERSL